MLSSTEDSGIMSTLTDSQTNMRPLTPEELQTLQNAADSVSGAVQRGLSFGVAAVSLGVGIGLGYLIWGRKG